MRTVTQVKAFVFPDDDEKDKKLETAAKQFKAPPVKKQAQTRIPRGGMQGRPRRMW